MIFALCPDIYETFIIFSDDELSGLGGLKRTLGTALKYSLIAAAVGLLSYKSNLHSLIAGSSIEEFSLGSIQKVKDMISNCMLNTN